MATLVSALDTMFQPTVATFVAQVNGGAAELLMRVTSSDPWAIVKGGPINSGDGFIVDNPAIGTQYKFQAVNSTPSVKAVE